MMHHRTVYEAEVADISRDGKNFRIVKRREDGGYQLDTPKDVATLDERQAKELCKSLQEAIDRAE